MLAYSLGGWDLDEAVAHPLNLYRQSSVVDGLIAHILACAIVDLRARTLDYADLHHQSAANLEFAAGEAARCEIELLTLARDKQLAMASIFHVTGARLVEGELKVFFLRSQLVEVDFQIKIFLVCGEIEMAGKQAADIGRSRKGIAHKSHAIPGIEVLIDDIPAAGRDAIGIAMVREINDEGMTLFPGTGCLLSRYIPPGRLDFAALR